MRALGAVVVAACAAPGKPTARPTPAFDLPVRMVEHRFFLETTTKSGAPLRLFLDSAGGIYVTKAAATRLGLAVRRVQDDDGDFVTFPEFADARIPRPQVPNIPVLDDPDEGDGMLGAPWFAGHAITFDYLRGAMTLHDSLPSVAPEHAIALALPRDDTNKPISPMGRIQIQVAGETLDMLFDTGATVDLLPEAQQVLGPGPTERATSFITESVFARWRTAHPEWRVIEHADRTFDGAPMIEVPSITVAGYHAGPVWFTWRPDKAFHEVMAELMDKPTEGALGGSGLHYFRVGADWARGVITFAR